MLARKVLSRLSRLSAIRWHTKATGNCDLPGCCPFGQCNAKECGSKSVAIRLEAPNMASADFFLKSFEAGCRDFEITEAHRQIIPDALLKDQTVGFAVNTEACEPPFRPLFLFEPEGVHVAAIAAAAQANLRPIVQLKYSEAGLEPAKMLVDAGCDEIEHWLEGNVTEDPSLVVDYLESLFQVQCQHRCRLNVKGLEKLQEASLLMACVRAGGSKFSVDCSSLLTMVTLFEGVGLQTGFSVKQVLDLVDYCQV